MATTKNYFTGNGSTTAFAFTFPYLNTNHIKVKVDGVVQATTEYTLTPTSNPTTVNFNTAPTNLAQIEIYRETSLTTANNVFAAGSSVKAASLNDNQTQALYALEEQQNSIEKGEIFKYANANHSAGATAPTTPSSGDTWFDSTSGRTYIYYEDVDSSQWVEANPPFDATGDRPFQRTETGGASRGWDSKLKDIVHVEDFGAVGDGTTNDTTAFQNAINAVSTLGGGTVHFGSKKYLIDSALTVKDYVELKGPHANGVDELTANGESNLVDYDSMGGQLIINSSVTITFTDSASLSNALIMRKGLTTPIVLSGALETIDGFSGTALTVGGAGVTFKDLLILGFLKAIYSTGFERVGIDFVRGDCSNGIDIRNCTDISYISNCHFWPFLTAHDSALNSLAGRQSVRKGTAYNLEAVNDWCKLTNCFSYGYYVGFNLSSVNDVTLIGCGADWVSTIVQNGTFDETDNTTPQDTWPLHAGGASATDFNSLGFWVDGTSLRTTFIGCQTAAQYIGYFVNVSNSDPGEVTNFSGCSAWGNDSKGVLIRNGRSNFNLCSFTDNTSAANDTGIEIQATADKSTIVQCDFENLTTPISSNIADNVLKYNTFTGCATSKTGLVTVNKLASTALAIDTSKYQQVVPSAASTTHALTTITGGEIGQIVTISGPPAWRASTAYIVGDVVHNDSGKYYECDTAGTSHSSGGPTGTSANTTDGSTRWDYVGQAGDIVLTNTTDGGTLNGIVGGVTIDVSEGDTATLVFNGYQWLLISHGDN